MFDPKKLREKRESLMLSVPQLAKLLKLKAGSIYKWEGGTRPKNLEEVKKVEAWLKDTVYEKEEDWKSKYYELLEKYTALLEKRSS